MTKRQITLTQEQFFIEQGLTWQVAHRVSIGAASSYYYGITTGGYWVQIDDRNFATEGNDSTFSLYRDTSFTGGTDLTIYNMNDNYQSDTAKKPFTVVKYGVTATPNAANLVTSPLTLNTSGNLEMVFGDESSNNIFLKPNTNYVFAITNNGAVPNMLHRFSVHCSQWSLRISSWRPPGG